MMPAFIPVRERIYKNSIPEPNSGCWLWLGYVNPKGYAICSTKNTTKRAHRLSYCEFVGPIPDGMEIDHKCRVRCCVNPQHLEPITHAENIRRVLPYVRGPARGTHCQRGHPFTSDNIITNKRDCRRQCRACRNLMRAAARKKARAT